MPVTAKLSRHFYEKLGDEATNELVNWFNSVDLDYRSELRNLNELNFARSDAKVEQRFAEQDARWERRSAELETRLLRRGACGREQGGCDRCQQHRRPFHEGFSGALTPECLPAVRCDQPRNRLALQPRDAETPGDSPGDTRTNRLPTRSRSGRRPGARDA